MEYFHDKHTGDECNMEVALKMLHNLCENRRMEHGDKSVWHLEMAIDCLQKYTIEHDTVDYKWSESHEYHED